VATCPFYFSTRKVLPHLVDAVLNFNFLVRIAHFRLLNTGSASRLVFFGSSSVWLLLEERKQLILTLTLTERERERGLDAIVESISQVPLTFESIWCQVQVWAWTVSLHSDNYRARRTVIETMSDGLGGGGGGGDG
jgi:hypothetical protein